jgi:Flp pilus assembly protein TadD
MTMQKAISLLFFWMVLLAVNAQDSAMVQQVITFDTESEYQQGQTAIIGFQYEKAARHFYECQRNEPENLEFLSKLAWCYLQLGNYPESKIYFKEVLKKDPAHAMAISNLAYLYELELNHLAAQPYYRQLLEIDSTNSYYYRLNAYNSINTRAPLQAIAYFSKAHTLNPNDLVVINELAELYLELDAFQYAEAMVEQGLKLSGNNFKLLYTAARIQNKNKAYDHVIELLEKTQSLGDTNSYYQMLLAVSYLQLDSLVKGIFQLEHIIGQQKETEHTHHYLSIAYDQKGDADRSMYHLEKALEKAISPKTSTYYEELAAHYDRKKDYKSALELYEEAYAHSGKPIYLFYVARNTDLFYEDKNMALRQYKKYVATGDTKYQEYCNNRIAELKEAIHLERR